MIITHPKYYTSEGEITADELVELIENQIVTLMELKSLRVKRAKS